MKPKKRQANTAQVDDDQTTVVDDRDKVAIAREAIDAMTFDEQQELIGGLGGNGDEDFPQV